MVLPVDPRANPSLGADFISGQITDKALALLDILNQVTGTKGNNVKQFDVIEDGQISNLTLGVHDIKSDGNAWDANQLVYFQSTPQRLALIQQKLQDNLTRIESDITNNLGSLFDLIQKNSANGGLDIEGQLNAGEASLNTAGADILSTGNALEQQIMALLTSDSALDTIIDAFIAKFNLDIQRLDSEIFNLLDDKDGTFSSNASGVDSTSSAAAKYLVSFGAGKPAVIANDINEVFDISFKSQYEVDHGVGSWTSAVEQTTLTNFIGNSFQQGSLKLDSGLIDAIITDKNISDNELAGITQQGQFLRKYSSFQEFLNVAGSYYQTGADTNATIKELTLSHLKSITPQYFDDNRTLQDVLSGKTATSSDSSNINQIFQSAGDQIKDAAAAAIELLGGGYKTASKNSFEDFIRNNPILIVQYLEGKNDPALDKQIELLIEFNERSIESQIQYYTESNKRLGLDASTNAAEIQQNQDMLDILQGQDGNGGILTKLKDYPNTSVAEIINLYNNPNLAPELKLGTIDTSTINDEALTTILEKGISIQNMHGALYANETLEAGKLNANYTGRELSKPNDDGEIPEDKNMAPPEVSPTVLSGVIAAMGNEILYKANQLLRGAEIPGSDWVNNNVSLLNNLTAPDGSSISPGLAFLNNLKAAFKDIIKQFVTSDVQTFKSSVDQAKTAIAAETALTGTDSNIVLIQNDTEDNLDNIEQAITGDIFASTNFINQAGLNDVKVYLEDVVSNSSSQIQAKTLIVDTITNTLIPGKMQQIADSTDPNEILALQNELQALQDDLQAKQNEIAIQQAYIDRANSLLTDPGKVNDQVTQLTSDVNSVLDPNNPPADIRAALLDNYKVKLEAYSNELTDHFTDDADGNGVTDIEQTFKDTLISTSLDLNNDGINDFENIQNTIDKISELGDNVTDVFGGKDAVEGGIDKQSIRRLILMMFAMSILEYSDWDYNKTQADMSNYTVD